MLFINSELASMVSSIKTADLTKVTLTFNKGKDQTGKVVNMARISSKTDEIRVAFMSESSDSEDAIEVTIDAKKFVSIMDKLLAFGKDVNLSLETEGVLTLSVDGVTSITLPLEAEANSAIAFTPASAILAMQAEGKSFNSLMKRGGVAVDANCKVEMGRAVTLKVNNNKTLKVCSTNGAAVATAKAMAMQVQNKTSDEEVSFAIPAVSYQRLLKVISGAAAVGIMATDKQILVSNNKVSYICSLATAKFDAAKFVEQWSVATSANATVDADAAINAIGLLEVADENNSLYVLRSGEGTIDLLNKKGDNKVTLVTNSVAGSFAEERDDATGVVTGIGAKLFGTVLKALDKGNVTIRTNSELQFPYVFTNGTVESPDESAVIYCLKIRQ